MLPPPRLILTSTPRFCFLKTNIIACKKYSVPQPNIGVPTPSFFLYWAHTSYATGASYSIQALIHGWLVWYCYDTNINIFINEKAQYFNPSKTKEIYTNNEWLTFDTTALFRANTSYMVVPASLLVIVTSYYPHHAHHAKLQTSPSFLPSYCS